MDTCTICDKKFILSDPSHFEFENKKGICKKCWTVAFKNTNWGAKLETRTIFEYKKATIPHELKWSIWKRDGFKCKKCDSSKNLSIDHINPESNGGDLSEDNLQTLCRRCNSSKGSKHG